MLWVIFPAVLISLMSVRHRDSGNESKSFQSDMFALCDFCNVTLEHLSLAYKFQRLYLVMFP